MPPLNAKPPSDFSLRPRGKKLDAQAYRSADVSALAQFFLGKQLMVRSAEGTVAGIITETEAYGGAEDKACHGHGNRRTARTEIMFAPGGVAYVYLCYGMHNLFNIITGPQDFPMAVLIRAVEIVKGEDIVAGRRPRVPRRLRTDGPGKVSAAMGIERQHYGADLTGNEIWLEDRGVKVPPSEIVATPRIGIAYAEEWVEAPLRFVWRAEGR